MVSSFSSNFGWGTQEGAFFEEIVEGLQHEVGIHKVVERLEEDGE